MAHDLVGVSHNSERCSCGVSSASWLEHLGEVAQNALGIEPRARAPIRVDADAAWLEAQQRADNLASFRRQPKPKRVRNTFTPEQLAVAVAVQERLKGIAA
jgi:hypothetical protein